MGEGEGNGGLFPVYIQLWLALTVGGDVLLGSLIRLFFNVVSLSP